MNLHHAAKALGRRGGKVRATRLDRHARQRVAHLGVDARWGRVCGVCGERSKEGQTEPQLGWVCRECAKGPPAGIQ